MIVLDLFSGTGSFSRVAKERGHEVFTIDFDGGFNPDLCIDILNFDASMLPKEFKHPDVIWASPPCTTFSVASISTHWKGGKGAYISKSKESEIGLKILEKTKGIIKELKPVSFIIENPRGVMRKFMPVDNRQTITYCQYGDTRMKPTDIWTDIDWVGRRCRNKDKCHIAAPRGSRTGTQGLRNPIERGRVPRRLCIEIIECCEAKIKELRSKS